MYVFYWGRGVPECSWGYLAQPFQRCPWRMSSRICHCNQPLDRCTAAFLKTWESFRTTAIFTTFSERAKEIGSSILRRVQRQTFLLLVTCVLNLIRPQLISSGVLLANKYNHQIHKHGKVFTKIPTHIWPQQIILSCRILTVEKYNLGFWGTTNCLKVHISCRIASTLARRLQFFEITDFGQPSVLYKKRVH